MLTKFLRAAAGLNQPAPTYNYVGIVTSTANASSYTFTSTDIGTAASNRTLVLVVQTGFGSGTAGNQLVSSITVGGTSAIEAAQSQSFSGTAGFGTVSIYYIPFTSGTTATVVVNTATGALRCAVSVYAVYGLSESPVIDTDGSVATNISSGATQTNTVSYTNGAIIFSGATSTTTVTTGYNWTNITENYDDSIESARRISNASIQVTGSGNLSVSSNRTGVASTFYSMVTASFR